MYPWYPLEAPSQKKDWPTKGVTIGAAPIGGVYYIWAGGPAKVLGEKLGSLHQSNLPVALYITCSLLIQRNSTSAW